jgi:hypothetical protein
MIATLEKLYHSHIVLTLDEGRSCEEGCEGRLERGGEIGPDATKLRIVDFLYVLFARYDEDVAMLMGNFGGVRPESRAMIEGV